MTQQDTRLALIDFEEAHLDRILAIRLSNPARLLRTEGSGGLAGFYDRGMLERDVTVALLDPNRHIFVASAIGEIVGYIDVLDAHPSDGVPWLGAVEIAAEYQQRGFAKECITLVAKRARTELNAEILRAAVDADDRTCIQLLSKLGFVPMKEEPRGLIVLEMRLA